MIREKGEGERAVGSAGSSWGPGVTSGLAGFAPLEEAELCAVGPVSGAGLGGCWAPPIGLVSGRAEMGGVAMTDSMAASIL
eukprot:5648681-Heterocapsa_arctica.AAC.1